MPDTWDFSADPETPVNSRLEAQGRMPVFLPLVLGSEPWTKAMFSEWTSKWTNKWTDEWTVKTNLRTFLIQAKGKISSRNLHLWSTYQVSNVFNVLLKFCFMLGAEYHFYLRAGETGEQSG